VEIRRKLAQANPQAFLPDLARSLGTLGTVLRGLERHAEAAEAFAEGLRSSLPAFRALPQAFGDLAGALLQDYLRACQEAGREPDAALVKKVAGKPMTEADLFRLVEAAGRGSEEAGKQAHAVLSALAEQENVPAELRLLARRLLMTLDGERDPDRLTEGLPGVLALGMLVLLAELRQEGSGRAMGAFAALVAGVVQGNEEARRAAQEWMERLKQEEGDILQALASAIQALLEGERDPDRLTAGWGEAEPLVARALRVLLGEG